MTPLRYVACMAAIAGGIPCIDNSANGCDPISPELIQKYQAAGGLSITMPDWDYGDLRGNIPGFNFRQPSPIGFPCRFGMLNAKTLLFQGHSANRVPKRDDLSGKCGFTPSKTSGSSIGARDLVDKHLMNEFILKFRIAMVCLSFRTLPKQFLGIFCGLGISRGSRCWELAAA